jgi:hypothetical protein
MGNITGAFIDENKGNWVRECLICRVEGRLGLDSEEPYRGAVGVGCSFSLRPSLLVLT